MAKTEGYHGREPKSNRRERVTVDESNGDDECDDGDPMNRHVPDDGRRRKDDAAPGREQSRGRPAHGTPRSSPANPSGQRLPRGPDPPARFTVVSMPFYLGLLATLCFPRLAVQHLGLLLVQLHQACSDDASVNVESEAVL